MVADDGAFQLPLAAALAGTGGRRPLRDLLHSLDEIGVEEIEAETQVDLERFGGTVGRPVGRLADLATGAETLADLG